MRWDISHEYAQIRYTHEFLDLRYVLVVPFLSSVNVQGDAENRQIADATLLLKEQKHTEGLGV